MGEVRRATSGGGIFPAQKKNFGSPQKQRKSEGEQDQGVESTLSVLQLAVRLLAAFAVLVGILLSVGILGINRMDQINANLEKTLSRRWEKLQLAREALVISNRNSRTTMQIFLVNDRQQIDELIKARADNTERISQLLAQLQTLCESEEEKKLLGAINNARTSYIQSYTHAIHLLADENQHDAGASVMIHETTPALLVYQATWDEFTNFQMNQLDVATHQSRANYDVTRRVSLLLIVTAVFGTCLIALFVIRKVARETRNRNRAEDDLKALNQELEDRVKIRTSELESANHHLLSEMRERETAEQQVQFLAYYDALTGLPNRTLLKDRMSVALATARRSKSGLAVLFLDLDNFKHVNDSLGHSAGDALLKGASSRLKKCTREQDTVARLGGDEFVVLLTGVKDASDATITADRIVSEMIHSFEIQEHQLNVTCSVGISLFPTHGADVESLIKNADVAMYAAKENGRNNFQLFTEELGAQVNERTTLETKLGLALEQERLSLVYQPQVNIVTGSIVGLEALLRWNDPELGSIPPDRFIPLAENTGFIIPIGEWVLRTACKQVKQWHDEGLHNLPISVNVSPCQFRQKDFVQLVLDVLHETGLAPHFLELELTEGLIVSNAQNVRSILQRLEKIGVQLSIDDFGTGYSNLNYLRHFPVHKLKIDRSFVRDLVANPDDAAITSTIINIAKNLDLKVIAEGVENEEQMSFLREHHCDEIQGFYFSTPLAAADLAETLRKFSMQDRQRFSTPDSNRKSKSTTA